MDRQILMPELLAVEYQQRKDVHNEVDSVHRLACVEGLKQELLVAGVSFVQVGALRVEAGVGG